MKDLTAGGDRNDNVCEGTQQTKSPNYIWHLAVCPLYTLCTSRQIGEIGNNHFYGLDKSQKKIYNVMTPVFGKSIKPTLCEEKAYLIRSSESVDLGRKQVIGFWLRNRNL